MRIRTFGRIAIALGWGLAGAVTVQADPTKITYSMGFEGQIRTYDVYEPQPTAACPASLPKPVLLAFHGGGSDRGEMLKLTCPDGVETAFGCLHRVADRQCFLAVFPDGSDNPQNPGTIQTWNAGNCCAYAKEANINDVGFVQALIGELQQHYPVDPARLYATGMSNGAMLTHRLACELSDLITAIAPIAGGIGSREGTTVYYTCNPQRPVPVVEFHGIADEHYPFLGGVGPKSVDPTDHVSIPVTIAGWVARNECSTLTTTDVNDAYPEDGTTVTKQQYTGCRDNADVVLYKVTNGGHTWPRGYPYAAESFIGKTTQDLSANVTLWDFLKQYTTPAATSMSTTKSPGTMTITTRPDQDCEWVSPNSAKVSDNAWTICDPGNNWQGPTAYLQAMNFGFAIPAGASITGIEVTIEKHRGSSGISVWDDEVLLVKNGSRVGLSHAGPSWSTTDAVTTYGSATDLWGASWTRADINAANFGVALSAYGDGATSSDNDAYVDHMQITVHYSSP